MKYKKILLKITVIFLLVLISFGVFALNNKKKASNIFFLFPDKIKSIVMILSGKGSFSNLYNDYNVLFLPNTQFFKLNFYRKNTDIENHNKVLWDRFNVGGDKRYSFFLEVFENKIFTISRKGKFYSNEIADFLNEEKKNDSIKIKVNLDEKSINAYF